MDVLRLAAEGPTLGDDRSASDLIGDMFSIGARRVAIPIARLDPAFLILSSRMAGDFLQKFVNYDLGVVLVGDVTPWTACSEPLAAFVRESNRGLRIWFVEDLAALDARLSQGALEA